MKDFMREAIKEAKKSLKEDEVPIGAVIVVEDKIIARGHNCREKSQNAIKHAEIIAIEKACKKLKSWRLENATIYVTLEPCPMCAGAIANARISRLVFGTQEKTSHDNLCQTILSSERLNHKVEIFFDQTHQQELSQMLSNFFKEKRKITQNLDLDCKRQNFGKE